MAPFEAFEALAVDIGGAAGFSPGLAALLDALEGALLGRLFAAPFAEAGLVSGLDWVGNFMDALSARRAQRGSCHEGPWRRHRNSPSIAASRQSITV
ncbi:hypothetical protein ASC88_05375 [Rhizobacter sp. Root29]|nr:hypothetical protein ASC88_05375 [Rhizobacter sp. Root29]